jgi:hypothetical protein
MAFVSIDSIVVDRALRPNDTVEDLAKSILDQGLKFPLLIRAHDRYLVDGLRRLEASKLAGSTTIEVVEARTFDDAVKALTRSHADTPSGRKDYFPWRINHIWHSIIDLPRKTRPSTIGTTSRNMVRDALHLSSDNLVQSTVYTYKIAKEPGPLGDVARAAVESMERGEMNGYGGRMRIYALREQLDRSDTKMSKSQAHRVLTQGPANLLATARGLQLVPMGLEKEAVDPETAKALWYSLEETRKIISSISSRLNKIVQSEETDS